MEKGLFMYFSDWFNYDLNHCFKHNLSAVEKGLFKYFSYWFNCHLTAAALCYCVCPGVPDGIKKLVFNDICGCCCCCSVKQPLKFVYMINFYGN